MDFDLAGLSLDLNKPAGDAGAAADPLATKLALAEEFLSIGDTEGARRGRQLGARPRGALERALALTAQVGKQSPPAVTACKELIQSARHGNIAAAYTAERESFVKLFDTRDQREGVNAFLEKRSPQWVNG